MLTLDRLKSVLSYDPAMGEWRWLVRMGPRPAGQIAGSVDPTRANRRRIMIDGKFYSANQLAWFYVTGEWAPEIVDHRNRDPNKDDFDNLRLATRGQNNTNRRTNAKSGLKGVYRCIRYGNVRFEVYLSNPRVFVGTFRSPIQAAWAYDQRAAQHYGEFAVLNFMEAS